MTDVQSDNNETSEVETHIPSTEEVLASMLKENTGTHMLDSGGAYGRHWQRNQGRDFEAEKETELKFGIYNGKPEITVTHNTYRSEEHTSELQSREKLVCHP